MEVMSAILQENKGNIKDLTLAQRLLMRRIHNVLFHRHDTQKPPRSIIKRLLILQRDSA